MNYPRPYANKVLVRRDKKKDQAVGKIILSVSEPDMINKGQVIDIGHDDGIKVKPGEYITFDYGVKIDFTDEEKNEYLLVPNAAIQMIWND